MTLELNQVAPQVKAMGRSLAQQQTTRAEALARARALLLQWSEQQSALHERIRRAEKVQQTQRFDWVGAAPTAEALAQAHPLPAGPEQVTVIASDGSQIYPDAHALTLYYLINVGCIVYRHGSGQKPLAFNPPPALYFEPDDLFDAQGNLISGGEVSVRRDLAELRVLVDEIPKHTHPGEPVLALMDGQIPLRVIDLPFVQQEQQISRYLEMLDIIRHSGALLAGYIDRSRSNFVLSLLHLAGLEPAQITEERLRRNSFHPLTDIDLFGDLLAPGERSALFAVRAKGQERYTQAGHGIHFFYLNVSARPQTPMLARVEIPAWVAEDAAALDALHATLVRQARISGDYPYVLARADELAVISGDERDAVEMMLAVELRRQRLSPDVSHKQRNKNNFRAGKERYA
ncbi:MAG: DNA double-strand break repair nuclease NurA [Chloroflexi bacterium]|nr:MAG: DNA double-strand break repair nuclease NurA [Chloroflexota bacterium]